MAVHDGVDGTAGRYANIVGQFAQQAFLSLRAPQVGFPAAA
jgi:hypothetical protein